MADDIVCCLVRVLSLWLDYSFLLFAAGHVVSGAFCTENSFSKHITIKNSQFLSKSGDKYPTLPTYNLLRVLQAICVP